MARKKRTPAEAQITAPVEIPIETQLETQHIDQPPVPILDIDKFLSGTLKPDNIEDVVAELLPRFKLKDWQKEKLHILFDPLLAADSTDKNSDNWCCIRLAISGGHGVGKTTFDCLVILLHLYYCGKYENNRSYRGGVISGRKIQLTTVVWAELAHLASMSTYPFEITTMSISYGYNHRVQAIVWNPSNPQAIQGLHAENMLCILDEAGAIPDIVFDKVESFFTEAKGIYLVTGNPYVPAGMFFNLFSSQLWNTAKIARDVTNKKDSYINDIVTQYGEDSDEYRIKILGEFPISASGSLFPRFLIDDAVARYNQFHMRSQVVCFGIDIASGEGADNSVLVVRDNYQIIELIEKKCRFAEFYGIILQKYQEYIPVFMGVDRNGVGHHISQDLTAILGNYCRIHEIVSTTIRDINSHDVRTLLYGRAREWLECGGAIPPQPNLINQLSGILIERTPSGKNKVLSKKELNIKSPDCVDAFAYSFVDQLIHIPPSLSNNNFNPNLNSNSNPFVWGM